MEPEEPSFKEKKYDRQIRLWGLGGQKALETSKICLLNASGVGTETLKNLVLPGIGSFTIIDGQTVTEADLGNNFFVTEDDLGAPRGERVTKWLLELNPDVKGSSLNADPKSVIDTNPDYFRNNEITLVIATQLNEAVTAKLASLLASLDVPLLLVRSYGLMGFVRIQTSSYAILETFPDQQVEDYHIINPFPELEKFVEELGDPSQIDDSMLHAHIPWVCLLIHYFKKWKQTNDWNGTELSYAERKKFLAMVAEGKRSDTEENYAEAAAAQTKINPPTVPTNLLELMGTQEAELLKDTAVPFWYCINSLKRFYAKHKRLPLNGKLNDMTSTTQWFVQLQNIFAAKAKQDIEEITGYVMESIKSLKAEGKPTPDVQPEYIATFCRNVWHVRYLKYRTLQEEMDPPTAMSAAISKELEVMDGNVMWYLLLRAADKFHLDNHRYPGITESLDDDVTELAKCLKILMSELSISPSINAEYTQEWVRYAAAELHNISAVLGGVTSQEAIKLITQQRVPINNTLIFNGINATMSTYEL
jgi:amyloid beta precursor protein binding protein 1|uniref:NEDD8-activating enzyme E1 regulatory subunit n=1 Tax=Eutreptiella gymnastica TaxID=73025 RepID=A0A7S4FXJ0_9EUGL|mmetsp:Transcript_15285/g.27173  ORF Transcript_15285/g.27173 Transcript_15285/m.27173 type:complete len:533 (+) Transcript_15285:107-1705(+)|eukprot:CAMPEP_0174280534 /NCGR_PEP_ID=MMETSP0809-20121228/830_1 /TAXON_ID=73025 ORGANISM="Eutreptiella gymnastica-like, Strain CCMP1594" /NCGR_SAMPLE_ID=MMETSP0809 /ASSEMBLY_ACC=CAM_ASM_000658 /LENGTH=532 /DNA_ID=CAMNT_0015373497 /DNA_START=72 /DNA_END=1670 /DNA_ORIENTATION=+